MKRRLLSMLLPALLGAAAIFLALQVAGEVRLFRQGDALGSGARAPADRQPGLALTDAGGAPGFAPPRLSEFQEVLERPVFSPTRRPPVQETVVPAADAPDIAPIAAAPDLRLQGIVAIGAKRVALVEVNGAPPLHRVSTGDEIGGWRVEGIDANGVVLRRGAESLVIELDYSESTR